MNRPIHTFAGLLTLGLAACGGDRAPGSNLNARALSRNGPSRTVAGAFTTIYRPDDGTSTTLSTPPPFQHRVRALLVPDASATCYSTFPIAPVLGAPTAPLINGTDGFTSQSGVGAQPTISWSPPTLGAPSSYRVNIYVLDTRISPGDVHCAQRDGLYWNDIHRSAGRLAGRQRVLCDNSANQADWDQLDRPPFRTGTPSYYTECVTGVFTP